MNPMQPAENEVLELIRQAQGGNGPVLESLIQKDAPLIRSIARKYAGRGTDMEDLCQIGCIGYIKAIRHFDEAFKTRFSTYAVHLIMGEIKRFLRDDGMIKVSRSLKEMASRASGIAGRLREQYGREPSISEIADELGVDPEEIVFAMDASVSPMSLDTPAFDDTGKESQIERTMIGDNECIDGIDRAFLSEMIQNLDTRERQIVYMRYFKDMTQTDTARLIGVSQVQISRLETRILKKMRQRGTQSD
jgi:RNA polymerase sporulation-specific sigma factor